MATRPKARPENLKAEYDLNRAMTGGAAKREAQDQRTLAAPSAAPAKSKRPYTRSDYETDHAIKQSVKYQKCGGSVGKMATGGKVRGMGAAKKGGGFSKNG